jgi:hypothetical protein
MMNLIRDKIMNKQLLLEKYIKVAVRKALQEEEAKQQKATKAMYLIYRFPGLKKVVEDLMSPSFGRFIQDVSLTAPKPTTFNIKLINDQEFYVVYDGRKNWTSKVSGKRYNMQELGEIERASQGIADLLELSYALDEKAEGGGEAPPKPDAGAEAFTAAAGAPETAPSSEEVPIAPEEEAPPAEA